MGNEALEILEGYGNLEHFGYLMLFLYCMGGGYVGAITAGALSSIGKLDLSVSIFLAIAGNIIGSSLFAIMARTQKRYVIRTFYKHKRKIAYLQIMLKKYDWILFFVSKYMHGVRTFAPLAVGISGYNMVKFLLINVAATMVWGVSLVLLGFHASGLFLGIIDILLRYPYLFPLVFLGIVGLVALFIYCKKKIKERYALKNALSD